ncbi:AcrR family transcriptional regulator [Actinopolyspora biskrensis]|uniref:AcrR family transcriptional regulator n=1 Tax=Actinopolyspora biskrensis TaxID=1470178 RepID=A0A852ZAY6_9ACTN|nr:AcrR family transcriptional regulator [Actinopolyspora biskrensis]
MSTNRPRRRAPAMSSEQRRDEIVRATLPLLVEQGPNITTRSIAQAAGVAEGTIFRVFADKNELLQACVSEAFRTDEACGRIRGIPPEQDLADRLSRASSIVLDYFHRLGGLVHNLSDSEYDVHRHRKAEQHHSEGGPQFVRDLIDACAELVARDEHRFRMPPGDVARMLLGLLMSTRFETTTPEGEQSAIESRIDVLLNGVLAEPGQHEHR